MNTLLNPETCPYDDQNCNTHAQCTYCVANGSMEMELTWKLLCFKRKYNLSAAIIARNTGLSSPTIKRALEGKKLNPLTVSKLYHMMWYYDGVKIF